MCTGAEIGLLLTAAGTGAQAINNNAAMRRQDRQAAEGIRRQGRIQQDSNARVNDQIADIAGSTGASERAASLDGFLNALRDAEGATTGSLSEIPGANERFAERVGAGKAELAESGGARAGRMSRIDAPRIQRVGEANRVARTATDLRGDQRRSRAEDFLTQLRVASERPNEFINALGSVASGAGSALTLGSGGGLMGLFRRAPDLAKLAQAGTLIDAPTTAMTAGSFLNA